MRERLAMHDWNYGFIVDGFPRNARQAEFFLESYDIDGVINLEMPDEEVHERVLSPGGCAAAAGSTTTCSPTAPGGRHLRHLRRRSSSARRRNPEALAARLRDYHEKTDRHRAVRAQGVRRLDRRHGLDRIAAIQAEIRADGSTLPRAPPPTGLPAEEPTLHLRRATKARSPSHTSGGTCVRIGACDTPRS